MANEPFGWSNAREALAEIRAYPSGLQTFVLGMFDQLDGLTERLLARELSCQQSQRHAEREVLQEQIDRLASVAAELSNAVAEQKQLTGQKSGTVREKMR